MYVYISEQENFTTFDQNSLLWLEDDLVYGDWTGGPNDDSSYEMNAQIPVSDVRILCLVLLQCYCII